VELKPQWKAPMQSANYAFTVLYNPTLMATKTSILIFYLRLSRDINKIFRRASFLTLAVVLTGGIVLTALNIFQCNPVSAGYHVDQSGAKCIGLVTLYLASAPFNIITDLAILCLPIPILTGMRLPQKQKTILVFTFALGIFVIAVDVVRIYYLQKAALNGATGAFDNTGKVTDHANYSYNVSFCLMWSCVEANTGIICACIPTLKPLVSKLLPNWIDDLRGSNRRATIASQNQPDTQTYQSTRPSPMRRGSPSPAQLSTHHIPSLSIQRPPASHRVHSVAVSPLHRSSTLPFDFTTASSEHMCSPPQEEGNREEGDMMDFLTTPGMEANRDGAALELSNTSTTDNTVYFGFVNMKRPKSMMKTKDAESFKYCTMVTILFFLWGFSYGLLNSLNSEIGSIYHNTTPKTLGLQVAYFGAYAVAPLTVGQWVLRHSGFKVTFIVGLCIYSVGTLSFWPSAVLASFPGFVISNFIAGFGLAVLETAANPFLALCGPLKNSEMRLLLAQAVQATGSVLSPLLAQKVLFRSVRKPPNLIDVQWAYLAIGFFSVGLALFFYYMPLPEADDHELQAQAEDLHIRRLSLHHTATEPSPGFSKIFGRFPVIATTFTLGVISQFFYVAAQESLSVWFGPLLSFFGTSSSTSVPALSNQNYLLIGHTTFASGRFVFAFLSLVIRPRILLLIALAGSLVFSILTFKLSGNTSDAISGSILALFFFNGPVWPLVFAITLRGLGRRTKMGAAIITSAASGGGVFPFILYAVERDLPARIQYSYSVLIALYVVSLVYPVYLNFTLPAARLADPNRRESECYRVEEVDPGHNGSERTTNSDSIRRGSTEKEKLILPIRKLSKTWHFLKTKLGTRGSMELPVVEHRENKSFSE
jgi:fucose permease